MLGRRWTGPLAIVIALAVAGPASAQDRRPNKALGKPATATSVQAADCLLPDDCPPTSANDGRLSTRWSSEFVDNQSWTVDLRAPELVDKVEILWERAYPDSYVVSTSLDGVSFTDVADVTITLSPELIREINFVTYRLPLQTVPFAVRTARYVRITGRRRTSQYGISIWEARVFGPPGAPAPPPRGAPTPGTPPQPPRSDTTPQATITPAAPLPAAPTPASGDFAASVPETAPPPPAAAAPRGLALLAPVPVVRIKGRALRRGARVDLLSVTAPRGSRVLVRCRGCPRRLRSLRLRGRGREVRVRRYERYLRAGTALEVFVTRGGTAGHYTRLTIRAGAAPSRRTACARPGPTRTVACPAPAA